MKKNLTKLGYMAFGCLLTLIGYHFGNIDSNSANAQEIVKEKPEIVDEIRCRKLVIVGSDGTPRITLGTNLLERGKILIYNEDGAPRILLAVDQYDSGLLEVLGRESGGLAASLGVNDYGGFMALFNKVLDKSVLQAGITDKGEGALFTRDKAGYNTGGVGPKGVYGIIERVR